MPGDPRRRHSFRARLAVWHTSVVAAILALAALGGHSALARAVLGQLDTALIALAETETAALRAAPGVPVRVSEERPGTSPPSLVRLDRFIQIIDLEGQIVARSANLGTSRLPVTPGMLARLRNGETVAETFEGFAEEPIRLVAMSVQSGSSRYAVAVAGSLDDAHAVVRAGRWLFLGLSIALLAASAMASVLFARRALSPIDEIVVRARHIGEANLGERLPHPGSQDELGRLVDTLNEMLARIERGLESQRRFTTDASHELRSPLSRLRAELEVTLRRPREAGEYQETLRSCLDEVVRLSELAQDLLTLARLDAEVEVPSAGIVPLSPLLGELLERLRAVAEQRGVTVVLQRAPAALTVAARPTAVALALTNVLDNAVKFSPPGGEVRVELHEEGAEALIRVVDSGPGIVPEEAPRVFDRFHRGAAARATDAHGFGLGLAISRAAVEREGGRIDAASGPEGGASFSIRLPLAR